MARTKKEPDYRAVARILKSQGIGAPLGRGTLKGHEIRGGKTLKEWADKLDPVLSGKATIVKKSAVKDKKYSKLYERVKPKSGPELLIVPHSADEKVVVKKGQIVVTHPSGIQRVQLPVEYHDLEQYLSDAMGKPYAMGRDAQYFAFRFYGGSSNVFRSMDDLLEMLLHYSSIEQAIEDGDRKMQRDIYRNLEIVRVSSSREWFKQRGRNLARKTKRKKRSKKK